MTEGKSDACPAVPPTRERDSGTGSPKAGQCLGHQRDAIPAGPYRSTCFHASEAGHSAGQPRDRAVQGIGAVADKAGQRTQAVSTSTRGPDRPLKWLPMTPPTSSPSLWPRLMRAKTTARYVDEKSVETFRRGVGTIWPLPKKVPGKGLRWLKDDLDVAIELIIGRQSAIFDAATVLGAR